MEKSCGMVVQAIGGRSGGRGGASGALAAAGGVGLEHIHNRGRDARRAPGLGVDPADADLALGQQHRRCPGTGGGLQPGLLRQGDGGAAQLGHGGADVQHVVEPRRAVVAHLGATHHKHAAGLLAQRLLLHAQVAQPFGAGPLGELEVVGAEQDAAEVAKKVAKEKYGLDVELVGFSGSLLPNDATNHGELDANVFQHRPFLEQDNQAHGYKLVAVGNTFVFPMAGYSKKIKTVAQIKEGATVAIPNDPTNLGRALLLLQKEKLITLKEGKGLLPTALDITDNPRHLQIMELEGAQLPRVLDDPKVDVAIISTTYIQQTGLSPVHDSVFIEDKNSPYVNILVAREDNKNAENVKEFLQSYQSPEVAKAAETIFNGGAVPGW